MDHFQLNNGVLYAEDIPLTTLAEIYGTPVYIYSAATLRRHARVFREALAPAGRVHCAFAVKANPNLAVLNILADEGYGADVVSAGELNRALEAGVPAGDIVFSGVGKTGDEIRHALAKGIGQFNIESAEEGFELAAIAAETGLRPAVALRVNPDVDAATHAKISTGKAENKFGVPIDQAVALYARLSREASLNVRGVAVHIGSQLLSLDPLEQAFGKLGEMIGALRDQSLTVSHIDLGGGLGVPYAPGEIPPSPADYGVMVARVTRDWDVTLMFEPGRVIAGNAGVMLTRVIRVKQALGHPFVIVDGAMNDLARPALYDAWHDFVAVQPTGETMMAHIVGPVCETGDTFARDREIDVVQAGDLAVFRTAGAYGATLASTYNSRALVPEVLVDGSNHALVADRIDPATIMAAERVPEWLRRG
ncbi:MAG: diaminopimelate decarboxylase [Pseudomonadota bacterium]